MSVEETSRPRSLPIGMFVVLALAIFCYIGMMGNLADLQDRNTDAMGRGLAASFALILLIAEWVLLAILMLIAGINGAMPVWSAMSGLILIPISGFAAGIALFLIDRGGSPLYQLVPGLLAPVLAGYALWARFPAVHRRMPPLATSLFAWMAVAILAAAPLPRFMAYEAARPAPGPPQKSGLQLLDEEEKKIRAETVAKYYTLTPDSPLWEWDNYLDDPELSPQAIAAVRQLSHRQGDAEQELRMGIGMPLLYHDEIDLAPSPAFCTAAVTFLTGNAREHRRPALETDFLAARDYFTRYEPAMRWLMQSGCSLDDAIAGMREVVAGYKQTDGRDAYLAHLDTLK